MTTPAPPTCTLSLHDALPICHCSIACSCGCKVIAHIDDEADLMTVLSRLYGRSPCNRSEEHTSELQSRPQLVCRLLLEKKNVGQVLGPVRRGVDRVLHLVLRV